jgi:uncharacterized protein
VKVSGSFPIRAPKAEVWAALQDPAVLARTLPGCESLEVTGPDAYAATLNAGVASIKGTYRGTVQLTDQQAPDSYRLSAEGAGTPGTIRADALVTLEEDGPATIVRYDADAVLGGMIGGVGQRMLTGVASKTAGEFFTAIERDLLGIAEPVVAAPAPVAGPGAPSPTAVDGGHAEVQVGQVFRASPTRPVGADRRVSELATALLLGALIALAGVLVGRRLGRSS